MSNIINLPSYEQVEQAKKTINDIEIVINKRNYNYQLFTASGIFTPPEGIEMIYVTGIAGGGGGGGGGGYFGANNGGSGGVGSNGAACFRVPIKLVNTNNINVLIGAHGNGGAGAAVFNADGIAGTNGGTTSLGTHVVLNGGNGGKGGTRGTQSGIGTAGVGGASASAIYNGRNSLKNINEALLEFSVYNSIDGSNGSITTTNVEPITYHTMNLLNAFLNFFANNTESYGQGGFGAGSFASGLNQRNGGNGGKGILLIEWGDIK